MSLKQQKIWTNAHIGLCLVGMLFVSFNLFAAKQKTPCEQTCDNQYKCTGYGQVSSGQEQCQDNWHKCRKQCNTKK